MSNKQPARERFCKAAHWPLPFPSCLFLMQAHTERRQLNHKIIQLSEEPSTETVGVLTKQGDYKYVPWGGLIKRSTAKSYDTAKPVKLEITEYTLEYSIAAVWEKVPPGRHVQGCLIPSTDGHSLRV